MNKHAYKTQKKAVQCIETGVIYNSQKEAEKEYNICRGAISNCIRGKQKTAGNLHWKSA